MRTHRPEVFSVTESELVTRLRGGDQSALDQLYRLYAERLLRTIYLITGSRPAAEDAVHDAFVEVLLQAQRLREPGSFRFWLYRIAVNKAKRALRRAAQAARAGEPVALEQEGSGAPTPEEAVLRDGEREALLMAVGQLDDNHRIPVVLRYYTGLTDTEIAAQLDIPVGTVKSRLYHARKTLFGVLTADERRSQDA